MKIEMYINNLLCKAMIVVDTRGREIKLTPSNGHAR